MFARTLRWVMTTPFGSAVAPEVKMISAVSSGGDLRCDGVTRRPSLDRRSQVSEAPDRPRRLDRRAIDDVADEQRARVDDVGDAREERGRGAVVDRERGSCAFSRQPQNAMIHSGRFSAQIATVCPRPMPSLSSRAANARAAARDLVVAVRPRPIAVVVDQEFAGDRRDVLEEIDQRAPRHPR